VNKELADLALPKEEGNNEEKTGAFKAGATRLALLGTAPFFLPAITTTITTLPTVAGLVGTATDISGYFRPEYSSGGQKFSLRTDGLIAAVAGSLRSEKRNVFVYNFYSMDTSGPQSKLMNMYSGVLDCSSRLAQSRNRLLYVISKKNENLAELKRHLKKTGDGVPNPDREPETVRLRDEITRETTWLDRATMEVLASDAIHAELGTFIRNITSTGTGKQGSKLAQAVFREKVHELGITHLLFLGVLSSGGESVTRKWFWGSGTISYMGGAVVSFVLSRLEGEVLTSDTLPVMYSFEFDPSGQRHSPLKQVRFEKQETKK
jgi:hypothetical protein